MPADAGPEIDEAFEKHIAPTREALVKLLDVSEDLRIAWGSLPNAESPAMAELAQEGRFVGSPPWGKRPVATAHDLAQLLLYGATDCAKGAVSLLSPDARTPIYAHTILARASLEYASRARWLLDPTIGVRLRVARAMSERLYSLSEQARLPLDKARRTARERRAELLEEAERQGFKKVRTRRNVPPSLEEERPGPTELVKRLLEKVELGGAVYGLFSAVAHGTGFGVLGSVTRDAANLPSTPGVTWGAVYTGSEAVATVLSAVFLAIGEAFRRHNELFGWGSNAWHAAWLAGLDAARRSLPAEPPTV